MRLDSHGIFILYPAKTKKKIPGLPAQIENWKKGAYLTHQTRIDQDLTLWPLDSISTLEILSKGHRIVFQHWKLCLFF